MNAIEYHRTVELVLSSFSAMLDNADQEPKVHRTWQTATVCLLDQICRNALLWHFHCPSSYLEGNTYILQRHRHQALKYYKRPTSKPDHRRGTWIMRSMLNVLIWTSMRKSRQLQGNFHFELLVTDVVGQQTLPWNAKDAMRKPDRRLSPRLTMMLLGCLLKH